MRILVLFLLVFSFSIYRDLGQASSHSLTKTLTGDQAVLRVLDKVAGRVSDISLKKGETLDLGKLLIIMGECRYPLANPSGDAFTFVKVVGDSGAKEIFRGWMIASSPAVSAIDHVRYDVWPIRCVTSDAVAE